VLQPSLSFPAVFVPLLMMSTRCEPVYVGQHDYHARYSLTLGELLVDLADGGLDHPGPFSQEY
jgi:hypothetical protein